MSVDRIVRGHGGLTFINDGTKTTILGIAGDYVRIGDAGTTGHSLNTNDDFMVTGKLEAKGVSYFDGSITLGTAVNIISSTEDSGMFASGGTNANSAAMYLFGKSHATHPGKFILATPNASLGETTRLTIIGASDISTATWAAITHAGVKLSSGESLDCAGTGANGWIIKNPKNAAASALSGTQLDVEIDIGGTPYHFTVYPTKA